MKFFALLIFSISFSTISYCQNKSGPSIEFDSLEFDFGTITQGDMVECEFTFTSDGSHPLVITQVRPSCGCTVADDFPKQPLKKGEKGVIKVKFDSSGKMGLQNRTVSVITNASEGAVTLYIKGNIEAAPMKNKPESRPLEQPRQ
jgi:hypothetical protein